MSDKEPVKTKKKKKPGRPEIADEQYWVWLEEMRPFLRKGASLWAAIEKAGLTKHTTVIYEKYREKGEFAEKIDRIQSTITELNNAIVFNTIQRIYNRQAAAEDATTPLITSEEVQIIKLVAEKHRTSQPYWVTRIEEAKAKEKDFGKVVERPTIQINPPKEDKPKDEQNDQPAPENPAPADSVQPDGEAVASVENPNQPGNE